MEERNMKKVLSLLFAVLLIVGSISGCADSGSGASAYRSLYSADAVSYTHLDVYKRQATPYALFASKSLRNCSNWSIVIDDFILFFLLVFYSSIFVHAPLLKRMKKKTSLMY